MYHEARPTASAYIVGDARLHSPKGSGALHHVSHQRRPIACGPPQALSIFH
jgi:hypothetical protein